MPMQNYTQHYVYDEAGNITELRHQAATGSYTRDYQYSSTNNKLQSCDRGLPTTPTTTMSCLMPCSAAGTWFSGDGRLAGCTDGGTTCNHPE
jgi:hypothetical protein